MATWKSENSLLTLRGVEILNKLNLGQGQIAITRIVAGSGRVAESALYKQTAVSGETIDLVIDAYHTDEVGTELSFHLSNEGFTQPFNLHQIGVYVTHPDYEGEILYHISQCDAEGADLIPAFAGNVLVMTYSLYLVHGNSSSISITIDPLGMVTKEEFENFKLATNELLVPINDRVTALTSAFNSFKNSIQAGKLVSVDANGNLIASGLKTVSGSAKISVSDAIEHRALSLSVAGVTTQETPTVTSPKPFVSTKVFDVRSRSNGKNLFDINATPIKKGDDKYSTITVSGNTLNAVVPSGAKTPYLGYLIHTTVGKSYAISFTATTNSVISYKELDVPIDNITSAEFGTDITGTKVYTATKPYLLVCVHPTQVYTGFTFGITNLQVEQSSSATAYAPFVGSTTIFPTSVELNSIGDVKDTIEWDGAKWWKVQRIAEVVLDGTVNKFTYTSAASTYIRGKVSINSNSSLYITDILTNSKVLSNYGNSDAMSETKEFYGFYASGNVGLHILYSAFGIDSSLTSADRATAFNNYLVARNTAGNPIKVRYVLATPVVTEIPVTEVLDMFATSTEVAVTHINSAPTNKLGYAISSTDDTTMYILKSLARKSDVQVANTFAVATLLE